MIITEQTNASLKFCSTSVPESFSSAHASFRGARACWEVEHNRQIIAAENGMCRVTNWEILAIVFIGSTCEREIIQLKKKFHGSC